MMETTLISTVYSIEPVMICITQFSPRKVVLIMEEEPPREKEQVKEIIEDTIGKFIKVQIKETSLYDVVQIAKDTVDAIDEERAEGRKVVINISGGRKTQALGVLFGCYARNNDVQRIAYVTEEEGEVIDLPILSFGISKTKKKLLEELKKGETSVKNLALKLGISRGMTYNHIRELRNMGFIDPEKLEITSAGEIAIL